MNEVELPSVSIESLGCHILRFSSLRLVGESCFFFPNLFLHILVGLKFTELCSLTIFEICNQKLSIQMNLDSQFGAATLSSWQHGTNRKNKALRKFQRIQKSLASDYKKLREKWNFRIGPEVTLLESRENIFIFLKHDSILAVYPRATPRSSDHVSEQGVRQIRTATFLCLYLIISKGSIRLLQIHILTSLLKGLHYVLRWKI